MDKIDNSDVVAIEVVPLSEHPSEALDVSDDVVDVGDVTLAEERSDGNDPETAGTEDLDLLACLDVTPATIGLRTSESGASASASPLSIPGRERDSSTASERERRLAMDRTGVPIKSRGKIVSLNEYTIVRKIGQGAFAEVKLGILDGVKYAIKIIDVETIMKRRFGFGKPVDKKKTDEQMDDTAREIAIMKLMVHPNLIELYEVLRDEDNKYIYLVMEYMAGGPLMKYNTATSRFKCTVQRTLLGNNQGVMNEYWCRKTFKDLISALGYLHCKFIVHRDLKPEK
jgi:serine/threonine protein kinase